MSTEEESRKRRAEFQDSYRAAYTRLSNILFNEDPLGINFEVNRDEYEPEVGTILPRLTRAQSADDVKRILHEEFVKWFDLDTVGPEDSYGDIAEQVWTEVVPLLSR